MRVDDPEFVERIQAREPAAIERVAREYLPQILRAAHGMGLPPQQAEDLAQATFTTFIETAPRFEGRSQVRTWLFGILYKKVAEVRRKVSRDLEMDDIDEVMEKRFQEDGHWARPPRPVDTAVYEREIREGLGACLEETPPQQRMAFILREIEELTSEEVCNVLDLTRTNLGVQLYRARNRLRECLEAKGLKGSAQ